MTDEAPFRITLQAAVVGRSDRGKNAIAIVCEGGLISMQFERRLPELIADVQLIGADVRFRPITENR